MARSATGDCQQLSGKTSQQKLPGEDGHIATTHTDPAPDLDEVYPLDAEMQTGATDPFSAMMTILERLDAGNPAAGSFRFMMGEDGQNLVSLIWAQKSCFRQRLCL